jgi:hypothetical protein
MSDQSTPITDAAALLFYDAYAMADVARRLELDRAALIEALERLLRDAVPVAADIRGSVNVVEMSHAEWEDLSAATNRAADTIAAARANFPTP